MNDTFTDTREKLLIVATRLFSERGYYGASISNIADELNLTKQALLHHFGSKERLYAASVKRQVDAIKVILLASMEDSTSADNQLETFFSRLCGHGLEDPDRLQIVVRELMDHKLSPTTCGLDELFQTLASLIKNSEVWRGCSTAEAMTALCQCFGAVHFFLSTEISQVAIYGRDAYEDARDSHFTSLPNVIAAILRK